MAESQSMDDSLDNSVSMTRHKIILVGDPGVGKTTIINRINDNPFNEAYEASIGVDFMSKNIKFRGQNIKLQMWDTAGQEKYRGLIPSYVRNSSLVFLVYDVGSKSSFDNIPKWIQFIQSIEKTTLILCGNKIDLENREVSKEMGEEFARKENITFFEVSAKTNENIKNMFYNVIADLPLFSENESNKENLVKELIQENETENQNNQQSGLDPNIKNDNNNTNNNNNNNNINQQNQNNGVLNNNPANNIVVDGKVKKIDNNKKKKGCHC